MTKIDEEQQPEEQPRYMAYESASQAMQMGVEVRRAGWPNYLLGMMIVNGVRARMKRPDRIYDDGETVEGKVYEMTMAPAFLIRVQEGPWVPWCPTQQDLLAQDWEVVNA